jgi:sugar lactone lactonase YvrE
MMKDRNRSWWVGLFWLMWFTGVGVSAGAQQPTLATTVPLILPAGLAYDAAGNLYFAETGSHVVRRVSTIGVLTTVAGTGVQGFAGDGEAAAGALLDSPSAVAVDAGGNLFIADAHNHRIRRVDAGSGVISTYAGTGVAGLAADGLAASATELDLPVALALDAGQNLYFADARTHVVRRIDRTSGVVTTVAGNGVQGFAGDLGLATAAALDSPSGIALDAVGNLYLADTHNQRVRRVDAVTGRITTVAGTGQPGFAGDAGASGAARLNLPRGLAMDAAGNLFVVDARNNRIRRIDAATGQIMTIAGQGAEAYLGDGGAAVAASLDSPKAVALSPGNLPTIADAGNGRVRQVDATAAIHTIAGLGNTAPEALTLAGPAVTRYGTGSVTATLIASAAMGGVTFFDRANGAVLSLGTLPLTANAASFSVGLLGAGLHRLTATYAGDSGHAAAQSDALALTVAAAPAVAAADPVAMQYGQVVPALTGSLTGVLPQDAGQVALLLDVAVTRASAPGAYPIAASLGGAAAGNYALTQNAAVLTVVQAATSVSLTNGLAVHVASTTSGAPTGSATLYDAGRPYATASLTAAGDAQFSSAGLSNGTHTLTAGYSGDTDFLAATSSPLIATIGASAAVADFTLAATGQTTVTAPSGSAASFSFAVNPVNGALSSPILLSVAGLPTGATASFNPAYVPPTNTVAAFILTVQTPKTAGLRRPSLLVWALLLPVAFLLRGRRTLLRGMLVMVGLAVVMSAGLGCGDRVLTGAGNGVSAAYNITVTGTATATSGATLQHSASVTLVVTR